MGPPDRAITPIHCGSLILEAQLVVGRLAPSTRMIFVGQFLLGKKYGRAYYSKPELWTRKIRARI